MVIAITDCQGTSSDENKIFIEICKIVTFKLPLRLNNWLDNGENQGDNCIQTLL